MIKVDELFKAVVGQANSEESGLVEPVFNDFLKLAELDLLDWLTGNVANPNEPPAPFLTSKNKDWLIPFIANKSGNFKTTIPIPEDYYMHQSLRIIWQKDCETSKEELFNDVTVHHSNKIETIKSSVIKGIKPTTKKPIGEMIGRAIELHPSPEGGQYKYTYIRNPIFAVYATKIDPVYKDLVFDAPNSKDLEWPVGVLPYFVYKVNDYLNKRNRESDAFQMNQANKPQNQRG